MRKGSKSKAVLHGTEAHGTSLDKDLGEMRAPDAAVELADDLEAEAVGGQPEDAVPAELNEPHAEPSVGQPADPDADQEATAADALAGTPSAGACKSGQLSCRSPLVDDDQFGSCKCALQLHISPLRPLSFEQLASQALCWRFTGGLIEEIVFGLTPWLSRYEFVPD